MATDRWWLAEWKGEGLLLGIELRSAYRLGVTIKECLGDSEPECIEDDLGIGLAKV